MLTCPSPRQVSHLGLKGRINDVVSFPPARCPIAASRAASLITFPFPRQVSHLGLKGRIHDYVSMGDNGKMVVELKEALGMTGKV